MKIPNRIEVNKLRLIVYQILTSKPYCFSVIDTTLASNNSSRFREDFLERI